MPGISSCASGVRREAVAVGCVAVEKYVKILDVLQSSPLKSIMEALYPGIQETHQQAVVHTLIPVHMKKAVLRS